MIIKQEKSIIPACDVNLKELGRIVKETADIDIISSYKVGFALAMEVGLPKACETIRKFTNKPIIYDHQKAGTDIPDTGKSFMKICKHAGINAVIFFPQAGAEPEKAWIKAAYEENLGVIVGGLMTHKGYTRAEGGYIADEAVIDIYINAMKLGVKDFVVPGTKPEAVLKIREMLEHEGGIEPVLYSPGLVKQGGDINKMLKATGKRWHAIVGRAIYESLDIKQKVNEMAKLMG